jgi:hypothetical protein
LQGRKERQARRAGKSSLILQWDPSVADHLAFVYLANSAILRARQVHFPHEIFPCEYSYCVSNLGGASQCPFSVSIAEVQHRSGFRASTRPWS